MVQIHPRTGIWKLPAESSKTLLAPSWKIAIEQQTVLVAFVFTKELITMLPFISVKWKLRCIAVVHYNRLQKFVIVTRLSRTTKYCTRTESQIRPIFSWKGGKRLGFSGPLFTPTMSVIAGSTSASCSSVMWNINISKIKVCLPEWINEGSKYWIWSGSKHMIRFVQSLVNNRCQATANQSPTISSTLD